MTLAVMMTVSFTTGMVALGFEGNVPIFIPLGIPPPHSPCNSGRSGTLHRASTNVFAFFMDSAGVRTCPAGPQHFFLQAGAGEVVAAVPLLQQLMGGQDREQFRLL